LLRAALAEDELLEIPGSPLRGAPE